MTPVRARRCCRRSRLYPAHLPAVWRVVAACGSDPGIFGPVVTLLNATGFPVALVNLLVGQGAQAGALVTWVNLVAGGEASRINGISQLLVAHHDHVPEVRQVVDHAGGDPVLAEPVLQLVGACAYRVEVLTFLVLLDASTAAQTSQWVVTLCGPDGSRRDQLVGLLLAHPGHVPEVRQVVGHTGGDLVLATPVLHLFGTCAYRGEVLAFLVSLSATTAAQTSQWVVTVVKNDAGRGNQLVDLLRAHPGHLGEVQTAVEDAGGDVAAASAQLTTLAHFGYSHELMTTATQLGTEHAEEAYDQQMERLRADLPQPSKTQQKKGFSNTEVELKKGKKADLETMSSTDQEFTSLPDEKQRTYVTTREQATVAKPQAAQAFTGKFGEHLRWSRSQSRPK